MDVAEDVVFGLDAVLDGGEQLHASSTDSGTAEITVAHRGSVCDEDVRVGRDPVPFSQTGGATRQVECPLLILRLPENKQSNQ